jgi:predicted amidohydrolase YtcJ
MRLGESGAPRRIGAVALSVIGRDYDMKWCCRRTGQRLRWFWVGLAIAVAGCSKPVPAPADLVLTGGIVHTIDDRRTVAEAIAIRGKRIVAVGTDEEIRGYIGPRTSVRDLDGDVVLPGLHDLHIHALGIVQPDVCDLQSEPVTLSELVPFVRECLDRYAIPDGEWLMVAQWNFAVGNQPDDSYRTLRAALDAVSLRHPIMLLGNDGHHAAVNSAALALARDQRGNVVGLSAGTLAQEFSSYRELIATDQDGEPSGGLTETARALVAPAGYDDDILGGADEVETLMPQVAAVLAASGITSIQDAAARPETLDAFAWLESHGRMTFRLRAALWLPAEHSREPRGLEQIPQLVRRFEAARSRFGASDRIRADAVKIFVDGVLEGDPMLTPPTLPNAAQLAEYRQPIFSFDEKSGRVAVDGYVDLDSEACERVRSDPDLFGEAGSAASFFAEFGFLPAQCKRSRGVLEHDEAFIRAFINAMVDAGFDVHAHVIGDRAARVAVDAFDSVAEKSVAAGLRHGLAHAQLIHPDDQSRIGRLGLYVAFTYAWILPEYQYDMTVIPFVDQVDGTRGLYDRSYYYVQNVYPAASVQRAGGLLVAGSDAPVDTRDPRPFVNIQQAVTRSGNGHTLNADERISIHDALAAYTINGARALGQDDRLGSLEPGKIADLIVVDQDIVSLAERGDPDRIGATRVRVTIFDGKVIFEADD